MQLYLIRHAESENNALYVRTGASLGRQMDPGLTDLGQCQAETLASFLAQAGPGRDGGLDPLNRQGFGLTHLYSSLMARAIETGLQIARALDLPLLGWVDWHEGGGIYLEDGATGELLGLPGKDRTTLRQLYPELVLPPEAGDNGWWNRPFEERAERWERARRVIEELFSRHGDSEDRIAIVTHHGFYNYFMKTLLAIDSDEEVWFFLNNAALSRLDIVADEVRLMYQNRLDYMPTGLISAG